MSVLSRTGWTVTADSDLGGGFTPDLVKDANTTTFWHSGTSSMPHNIDIDMGSATRCNVLQYIPRQSAFIRAPYSVEIYVSSDGSTWGSAIAARSDWDGTIGLQDTDTRWIDFPPTTTRYLRLKILSGSTDGYSACAELYLYDEGSGNADFMPHDFTTDTSHSPFVISESSASGGTAKGYRTNDSLLGNSGYWIGTGGGVDWWKVDTTGSARLYTYHVQFPDFAVSTNGAPKNWTMEGSNDGSSWTTVDTVTNSTGWVVNERRMFDCDTTTTDYRYFRLNISANNGDATNTFVGELYLYGALSFGPLNVTELVSDTIALSDALVTSAPTASEYTDAISLTDAASTDIVGDISVLAFDDQIVLYDGVVANFGIKTPPSLRGNIDYDQIRAAARSGDGPQFLMLKGSFTAGNVIIFDADGNAIDSGHT